MMVFLEIAGRDRSIEFSLNMMTASALYPKTIQGKPLPYINTVRSAKEAARVFCSARTTEVLTVMTVFLGIAGRDRSIEFFFYMKTTSALYQKTIQGKPLQYINTMRTAKEAAFVFGNPRTTEVLTVMTVFL